MTRSSDMAPILMADDDADDRMLTKDAFAENHLANEMRFVEDGAELMDYLRRRGKYADKSLSPRPCLILLDLNMPKMSGRECLAEIKGDPELRSIPIVVLTTSTAEEDLYRSYELGVSSYISKPVTFDGLVEAIGKFGSYWFELALLPKTDPGA